MSEASPIPCKFNDFGKERAIALLVQLNNQPYAMTAHRTYRQFSGTCINQSPWANNWLICTCTHRGGAIGNYVIWL